jgi:hypothetical protein
MQLVALIKADVTCTFYTILVADLVVCFHFPFCYIKAVHWRIVFFYCAWVRHAKTIQNEHYPVQTTYYLLQIIYLARKPTIKLCGISLSIRTSHCNRRQLKNIRQTYIWERETGNIVQVRKHGEVLLYLPDVEIGGKKLKSYAVVEETGRKKISWLNKNS